MMPRWWRVSREVKAAKRFGETLENALVVVRPDGTATLMKATGPNSRVLVEGPTCGVSTMMQKVFGGVLIVLGLALIVGLITTLWLIGFEMIPMPVEGPAFAAGFFTLMLGLFSVLAGAFLSGWDG